jgi:hypothetical protein
VLEGVKLPATRAELVHYADQHVVAELRFSAMAASREQLVARIDAVRERLARSPTRAERRAGWVDESRTAVMQSLDEARTRLLAPRPLDPREFPASWEALRGLDAWGIDVAADDPLVADLLSLAADLRKTR